MLAIFPEQQASLCNFLAQPYLGFSDRGLLGDEEFGQIVSDPMT